MDKVINEKFIVCNYLKELSYNGKRYMRTIDDFVVWLFTPADGETVAYQQYGYLHGRKDDFIPFLRQELGYDANDTSLDKKLFDKYYGSFAERYEKAVKQNFFKGGR